MDDIAVGLTLIDFSPESAHLVHSVVMNDLYRLLKQDSRFRPEIVTRDGLRFHEFDFSEIIVTINYPVINPLESQITAFQGIWINLARESQATNQPNPKPQFSIELGLPIRYEELLSVIEASLRDHRTLRLQRDFPDALRQSLVDDKALLGKERGLLTLLGLFAGKTLSRELILDRIFAYQTGVTTHTLETHIYRLRQKYDPDHQWIITKDGGYQLKLA